MFFPLVLLVLLGSSCGLGHGLSLSAERAQRNGASSSSLVQRDEEKSSNRPVRDWLKERGAAFDDRPGLVYDWTFCCLCSADFNGSHNEKVHYVANYFNEECPSDARSKAQSYFDQDYGKKPLLKIKKVKILPNVRSYVSNVQCEKVKFGPSAAQQRESCGKCVKKTIYGKANEHYEECEAYRRLNGHVSWTAWMHMVQKKLDGGMTPQEYYEGPQDDYEY